MVFQSWEFSLFAANCEYLTILRNGLAANIFIWPLNLHVVPRSEFKH